MGFLSVFLFHRTLSIELHLILSVFIGRTMSLLSDVRCYDELNFDETLKHIKINSFGHFVSFEFLFGF